MAKFGFLSVLEEEMDNYFTFDYAIDWDKSNHAIELTFVLEAQNQSAVETIDGQGEVSSEDIIFEDFVLFYRKDKSQFNAEDYLVSIPFDAKKGLSREFLSYFAKSLNDVATQGLDDLMDFLSDDSKIDYGLEWDEKAFENGRAELIETDFYPYPRY